MTARTLSFPPGPSSATLLVIAPQHTPPRQMLEAVGTVTIPAGGRGLLQVGPEDLDALALLKPGDVDAVLVKDPGPGLADALRPLDLGSLSLRGSCAPGGIADLAELEDLTSLELHGVELDAESAEALAGMSGLRSLKLDGGASELGVAAACRLTGLTRLVLSGNTGFSDSLEGLSELTELEVLVLSSPDLDDSVFARVVGLSELRHLSLKSSHIRGKGIEVLCELPRLADLSIRSPAFDISSLEGLVGNRSLAKLAVIGAAVDDQAAPLLAALSPPLREVAISASHADETPPFSLSAQVWLARSRPELSLNGGFLAEKAIAKYVAAGLGRHPLTGEEPTP